MLPIFLCSPILIFDLTISHISINFIIKAFSRLRNLNKLLLLLLLILQTFNSARLALNKIETTPVAGNKIGEQNLSGRVLFFMVEWNIVVMKQSHWIWLALWQRHILSVIQTWFCFTWRKRGDKKHLGRGREFWVESQDRWLLSAINI